MKNPQKGRNAQRRADSGSEKAPVAKRARASKNSPETSKTAQVLAMLKRAGGATTAELLKVTGWQAHSLRGFLSGTLRKKMELDLISSKAEDGGRSYSIKD